jgi:hypothetical protein
MSRVLDRNQRALDAATEPAERARRWAERSALLLRALDVDRAQSALAQAHAALALAEGPAGELAAARNAIGVAEAMADALSGRCTPALTRLAALRAEALALPDDALAAHTESVLALTHLRCAQPARVAEPALAALSRAPADAHDTRYQALFALAMVHHYAGNYRQAMDLFAQARVHVRAADNDLAQGGLLAGMVLAEASDVLQRAAAGTLDAETLRQALVGIQTVINRDVDEGLHANVSGERLIEAELRVLSGDIAGANALLQKHLPSAAREGAGPHYALGSVVQAVCTAHAGDAEQTELHGERALALATALGSPDVLGPVLWLLARAWRELAQPTRAAALEARARDAWSDVVTQQRQVRDGLPSA